MKPALIAIIVLILLLPGIAMAAITQSLQGADSLRVGDVFTLRLEADYPIERVAVPDSLSGFSIIGSKALSKDRHAWQMKIVPLKTGALSFPKVEVISGGSGLDPEYTDAFRVYVLSVLAEGDTLLRDIKPLERYPMQLPIWMYVLMLLVALGPGVYLLLKKPKKQKAITQQTVSVPIITPVPPWKRAMAALEALHAKALVDRQAWVELYFGLSEVLRGFLEDEYRFAAMEMTVSEIGTVFTRRSIAGSDEIMKFLRYCDLVKFAKAEPDASLGMAHIEWLNGYLLAFATAPQGAGNA